MGVTKKPTKRGIHQDQIDQASLTMHNAGLGDVIVLEGLKIENDTIIFITSDDDCMPREFNRISGDRWERVK